MPKLRGLSTEQMKDLAWTTEFFPSYGPIECPECGQNRVFFHASFGGWECNGCKMIYSSRDLQLQEDIFTNNPDTPEDQKI